MSSSGLLPLYHQVLWAAFGVSVVFGVIAQRAHFCTMGALSDVVHMGDWSRMRMWAMALGCAMIAFHLMAWLGWINPNQTLYTASRVNWLSALTGGVLFGWGMTLASGCGAKTLVRIGSGSLKSLIVFVVMGLSAFMTLRGITAQWRANTVDRVWVDITPSNALPAWLSAFKGWDPGLAGLLLALGLGGALIVWALSDRGFRASFGQWLAGLGVGGTVAAMWWVSGWLGFVPEHPDTLEAVYLASNSGRMEALSFTAPLAYTLDWLMFYSDKAKLLTLGVASVAGVLAGAGACALSSRSFHWAGFRNTQDTALHLLGAVCMGVGGVTAMGCSIGHGLSGLSTLSLSSALAMIGIVAGAMAGFRFQNWLLERA